MQAGAQHDSHECMSFQIYKLQNHLAQDVPSNIPHFGKIGDMAVGAAMLLNGMEASSNATDLCPVPSYLKHLLHPFSFLTHPSKPCKSPCRIFPGTSHWILDGEARGQIAQADSSLVKQPWNLCLCRSQPPNQRGKAQDAEASIGSKA